MWFFRSGLCECAMPLRVRGWQWWGVHVCVSKHTRMHVCEFVPSVFTAGLVSKYWLGHLVGGWGHF